MRIGKITIGTLDEWPLTPGAVTTWHPTPASAAKEYSTSILRSGGPSAAAGGRGKCGNVFR